MIDHNEALLTPAEVANLLGVAPVTIRAWAAKGLFAKRLTPGGHRRFIRYEVERFARQRGMLATVPAQPTPPRALLVDDGPQSHRLLGDFLARYGIETVTALDGFAAGFQLATLQPALVFLNGAMPGIDRLAVCRQIKAEATTSAIRIVILGGEPSDEHRAALKLAGAEYFIETPADLVQLATQLALVEVQGAHDDDH
jgi:excisionase family DNA binding protein